MIILSIETSCDETAVSLIDASGGASAPVFKILGNALYSQAESHAEYGGVFPSLAKREHARNLVPMLSLCIEHAKKYTTEIVASSSNVTTTSSLTTFKTNLSEEKIKEIEKILERENGLAELFITFVSKHEMPNIDAIAVTQGPGLEPALWVGISFAKALAVTLNKPIIPVNHMEGHIVSILMGSGEPDESNVTDTANTDNATKIVSSHVQFPAIALLVSGGHTELVQIENWHKYKVLGATKDDAVGEAFDKVARLLNLPYPGGPKISKLAAESRAGGLMKKLEANGEKPWVFPRPMIKSPDFDFSFSGLKTSVLYAVKKKNETQNENNKAVEKTELSNDERATLAEEFENAVTEVLVEKTRKALAATGAKTLILGGGVVANTFIRKNFEELVANTTERPKLFVPSIDLSTDNSVMIGVAGYLRYIDNPNIATMAPDDTLKASGNLSL